MDGPLCPTLPNELWIRVLRSLDTDDDLSFIWITCRHVCSVFKDASESVFLEKLLPKLRIDFQLGDYLPPMRGGRRQSALPLSCEFEFQHLSEDNNTATLCVDKEMPDELKPITRKRMRESMAESHLEIPLHIIQIRRDINDGPISGLSIDYDKLELSCNWREVFTAFYGEEFLYHKLLTQAVAGRESWLAELKAKVDKKEMDPQQVIMKAINGFAEDNMLARKMARRARVKRQFAEFDGTEWDFSRDGDEDGEERVLKSLAQLRQFASFEEWSDDEDDVDDEDGEDGSGVEWETEDEEDGSEDEGSGEDD
ncbi:hypothetical protein EG329_011155 [Mollisiaceae sp. DMI_Dod_QoI]|nr:hypothetical protein EG329_011155 [Helotiales sp. DMI_Dod_QoI]